MEEYQGKRITNWFALISLILVIIYILYLFLMVTPCSVEGNLIPNPTETTLSIINYIMWIILLAFLIVLFLAIYLGIKKYKKRGVNLGIVVFVVFVLFNAYILIFQCS